MKKPTRSVRVLAALLSFAFPAISFVPNLASAAGGYVTLSSFSGTPGSSVTASGGGWPGGDALAIYFGTAAGPIAASTTADSAGEFSIPLTIPANAMSGPLAVLAVDSATHEQESNSYYVNPLTPSITISAPSHSPFATVSVSGSGFAPHETVHLGLAGATSDATADGSGAFTGSITIPTATPGLYHLNAVGASSGASVPQYSNYFWIDGLYPAVTPSSYYVMPGAELSFSGSGFAPHETIVVAGDSGSSTLSSFAADGSGAFSASGAFAVPILMSGATHAFTLTGAKSGATASADVTIGSFYPSLAPASYYAVPNASLLVSGAGFAPDESVTISTPGASSTIATADADGAFSSSIIVPFSKTGSATITAVGSLSKASTSVGITLAQFYATVSPSSYFVYPGALISYHGTGFAPNESVSVTSGGTTSTVSADSNGSFTTASSTVPFGAAGTLNASFVGNLSGASAQAAVTVGAVTPYLSSDAYSIQQGDIIHVTGFRFAPGESVTVKAGSFATTTAADASGNTPAVAVVAPYGTNSLAVTFAGDGSKASASLTVALSGFTPQVTPSTFYTLPNMPITFAGTGFAPNEHVDVTFNGTAVAGATASPTGGFSYDYTPSLLSTAAAFIFKGETSGASIPVTITLAKYTAYIQLSTYYAQGGSPLEVTGTGFAPYESITLKGNGMTFATSTADASGNLTYSGIVPYGPAGDLVINAVGDGSGASGTATMTRSQIYTNLQLKNYAGAAGSPIEFIGSGYLPDETISITTDRTGSTPVFSFAADASGSFDNSGYVVPASWTGGPLVVTAVGDHSFVPTSITYYVTGK